MAARSTPSKSKNNSESAAGPTLTQPFLHYILSSERRIHIIDALADPILTVDADDDGWVLLSDLAEEIATREGIGDDEERKVYSSLYHHHLAKLTAADIIEQDMQEVDDDNRCVVRPGSAFTDVLNARNAVALVQEVGVDE